MKTSPKEPYSLQTFASLDWYEAVIKFLFTFTAKTSEVLLAAGLITSTANFLMDGAVMGNNTNLASAWAWTQALAIDSSLGVTCSYVFVNIKERDWIKVFCYGLLTLLLAIVAGTITNVDTLSHAIHTTMTDAITQVGLNMKVLTTLRAIAVVGFLLMGRLKNVSFKELYQPSPPQMSHPPQDPERAEQESQKLVEVIQTLIAEAMASLLSARAMSEQTLIVEEQETMPLPMPPTPEQPPESDSPSPDIQRESRDKTGQEEPAQAEGQEDSAEERESKLAHAYQELQAEGKRISGRSLAARAHIRRSTCNQWLAAHHPEIINEETEEEPEQ